MATSFSPLLQKAHLADIEPDVHGRISLSHGFKGTAELDGVSVTEVTFGVGARWSVDLKHDAGTESCLLPHVALVIGGTLHVELDGGGSEDYSEDYDVMLLPPGHDAWSVGDVPARFVEFSRGNDYYA